MNIIEIEGHKVIIDYLNEDSIVFDCGACIGNFTQSLWDRYHCNFYLYEPDPRNFKQLRYRFKDNNKIRVYKQIITEHNVDITKKLYTGRFATASSIYDTHRGLDGGYIEIPTTCIESEMYMHNIKFIDLLKLDIEGTEIEVIPSIPENINQITVEFHLQSEIKGYTQEKINICREHLKKQFNEIEYVNKGNDGHHGLYLNKRINGNT